MKEIQVDELRELQMQILDYVDAFCRENDINYTISGGTLLGAVRHGGFIPWDDDMDIQMLRAEYERFTLLWNNNKESHPFEFISIESGNGMGYSFGKVHNPKTVTFVNGIERTGVYIDVFPIDDVKDISDCKRIHSKIKKMYRRMMAAFKVENNSEIKKIFRFYYNIMTLGKSRIFFAEKINSIAQEHNNRGYQFVFELVSGFKCDKPINKAIFSDFSDIKFEDRTYRSIKNYDSYLKSTFGDYMTPPPPSKQVRDHTFKPYWR